MPSLRPETMARSARKPSLRRGPGRPNQASGTQKIWALATAGVVRHDRRRLTMSGRTLAGAMPHHDRTIASGAAATASLSLKGVLLQSRSDHGLGPPAFQIMSDTHE